MKAKENVDGIKVGQPCTMGIGSDCYPGVVVRVTPKTVVVQDVKIGKNKVQWPDQDFEIFLDQPSGFDKIFYRNERGGYNHGYTGLSVGSARHYLDPSF